MSLIADGAVIVSTKNCCEYAKEVIGIISDEFEDQQLLQFHIDDCHNIHDEHGRIRKSSMFNFLNYFDAISIIYFRHWRKLCR